MEDPEFCFCYLYLLGEAFPGDSIITAPACALPTVPGSYARPREVLLLAAGLPRSRVLCALIGFRKTSQRLFS